MSRVVTEGCLSVGDEDEPELTDASLLWGMGGPRDVRLRALRVYVSRIGFKVQLNCWFWGTCKQVLACRAKCGTRRRSVRQFSCNSEELSGDCFAPGCDLQTETCPS